MKHDSISSIIILIVVFVIAILLVTINIVKSDIDVSLRQIALILGITVVFAMVIVGIAVCYILSVHKKHRKH